MHPLYHHATRLVGQPVYLHHVNGKIYHGTLLSTTPKGVYVMQHPPGTRLMSGKKNDGPAVHLATGDADADLSLVYSPGAFFAFGALTGLTAGAMMGGWMW